MCGCEEKENSVCCKGKEDNTFKKGLTDLINRHSEENGSNTPDFLLADYLCTCLDTFNKTTTARNSWYGVAADVSPIDLLMESD